MVKYLLVSKKFEGYLVYSYHKAGYLMHFENCSFKMEATQLEAICLQLRHCLSKDNFQQWAASYGHTVIPVEEDLSFERFWMEYDNPRDRYRCEPEWKKLNDEERQYVFHNLQSYKRYMKRNDWLTQLLPETYLKSKNWRDEWDKIKTPEKKKQ